MNRILRTFVAAAALLLCSGCTTDEAVEGKACNLDVSKERQCITGYECICEDGGCFCRASSMTSAGLTRSPLAAEPADRLVPHVVSASEVSASEVSASEVSASEVSGVAYLERLFGPRVSFHR